MTRDKILEIARKEIGTSELPANSNRTKYGVWYGMNGVAWCAIYVSWVYEKAGLPLGLIQTAKGYHHCQSAHNWFKRNGRLTTNPQKGDIVLFDWSGDNWADHTGIFVQWTNAAKTEFLSLEGNTSVTDNSNGGLVMERKRRLESVKSFACPDVLDGIIEAPSSILQVGDRGSKVVDLQKMLQDLSYTILVDGWYGLETERIVKDFQKKQLMPITGSVDEVCLGAIQEEHKNKIARSKLITGSFLKAGDAGFAVVELQKALNNNGANPKLYVDGQFGRGTTKAVKDFQKSKKLTVDGVVGPQTWKVLGL